MFTTFTLRQISIRTNGGIITVQVLPEGVRIRPLMINPRSLGELPREAERGNSLSPSELYLLRGGRAGGSGLWRGGVTFTLL